MTKETLEALREVSLKAKSLSDSLEDVLSEKLTEDIATLPQNAISKVIFGPSADLLELSDWHDSIVWNLAYKDDAESAFLIREISQNHEKFARNEESDKLYLEDFTDRWNKGRYGD